MNHLKKEKPFKLYAWIGLAFLSLWLISDLVKYTDKFFAYAVNETWRVTYVTVLNFTLFEYSLAFVTRKRKTILYNILLAVLVLFVYMMAYSWGLYTWRSIGIGLHIYTALTTFESIEKGVTQQMSYSVMSVFFFGIIRHIYHYVKLKQATQQLLIEKQQAELNYLRSQTNPHFLFNTLNNIYGLARDKSDLAPESILRLSKILRFMLYETSGAFIAIEQELKIINDYVALEKLRYDDSLRVTFNYDVEDMKQALPPLLLIPLVENAFKHGVAETRHQPFVEIHLSVKDRRLIFLVKNSIDSLGMETNNKENIGLSNLRKQLQLLYNDYDLSREQSDSAYTAKLTINLKSHV